MKLILAFAGIFISQFFILGASSALEALPDDYGRLPIVSEVAISPNGKRVAMIENRGETAIVSFYGLDSSEGPTGVPIGKDVKARDLIWASDDYVLLLISVFQRLDTVDGFQEYEILPICISKRQDP